MVVVGAALVSWLVGALIRRYAAPLGLIDHPNERSSHIVPTPRGGGAGIVLAAVGGMLLLDIPRPELLALAGGGLFIAVVSFIDDLWSLPALLRLAVHVAGACVAVYLVGAPFGAAGALLAVVWIVGLTNAYNFMDGTDGLAGGQGVVAAAACGAIAVALGRADLAAVSGLIAAACLGFLVHNWSPARLFMGDVGSAFLGYSLAVLTVVVAQVHLLAAPAMLLALWPFVFDPILTLIRRASRRENLLRAHRSHLYQRLVAGGWTHAQVAWLYGALAVGGAIGGLGLVKGISGAPAMALAAAVAMVLIVVRLVRRVERTAALDLTPAGRV